MRVRYWAFSALAVALLCAAVWGQALRGKIDGAVKDPQGQFVPNAAISLRNLGTGETLTTTSTGEGTFTLSEVKPGTSSLSTEL
jgi:hypothetical protein